MTIDHLYCSNRENISLNRLIIAQPRICFDPSSEITRYTVSCTGDWGGRYSGEGGQSGRSLYWASDGPTRWVWVCRGRPREGAHVRSGVGDREGMWLYMHVLAVSTFATPSHTYHTHIPHPHTHSRPESPCQLLMWTRSGRSAKITGCSSGREVSMETWATPLNWILREFMQFLY